MTKQAKPKKTVKAQAPAKPAPRPKAAAKKIAAKPVAAKKPAAKKPAVKKAAAKTPLAKKPAAVVKKAATKAPVAKKPAAAVKKPAVKKPAAKQAQAKKPVIVKAAAKKPAAKQPAAKQVAAKPAPKKAPAPEKKPEPAPKAAAPAPQPVFERRAAGYYNGVLLCEKPGVIPAKSPYTDRELVTIREMLQAERRHLLEVLRDLDAVTLQGAKENGKSASPGYSIHLAEDASDNVETETALLVRREEEEALMQVNAAFERLDHGIFGVCVACGCKIGMPRLKAKTEAHLCIDCKQIYDKKASRR